jgi:hypothetical protein
MWGVEMHVPSCPIACELSELGSDAVFALNCYLGTSCEGQACIVMVADRPVLLILEPDALERIARDWGATLARTPMRPAPGSAA